MKPTIEFITASAGSGKTYRLVETVSEAIEAGECRPEGVIATTFTIAAANELRERLASKLYESEKHDEAALLNTGMIGTVHGVCLDILTRFTLEAGLSPDLTILDESQSKILLSRAFDQILSNEKAQVLYELTHKLGQRDARKDRELWRDGIPQIVENARSNDLSPDAFMGFAKASWEEMHEALPKTTKDDLDSLLREGIKTALEELDPHPKAGNAQAYLAQLSTSLSKLEDNRLSWPEWQKLTKPKHSKAQKDSVEKVSEIAERWGQHPQLHQDLEHYLHILFEIAIDLYHEFGRLKREVGAVDFADLEKETLDLLKNSKVVRDILTKDTDLLVVDEFQDTSPIQLALFSQLANCAKRVVWVGDVKQAIYGFRNADPDLITAAVSHAEKSDTLDRSWRSVPDLVDFSNELFAPAFAQHLNLSREEVTLTPQRTAHPDVSIALRICEIKSSEFTKGKEPKLKALTNATRPAASADAIKEFLDSGAMIVDKTSASDENPLGKIRPVAPKDVAVLVRKNDSAIALASELRLRGVDVSLSCPGMLESPEARFAIACLRVLFDSKDTLAIAEILSFENKHTPEDWITDRILQLNAQQENGNRREPWACSGDITSPTVQALVAAQKTQPIASLSPLALFDLSHDLTDLTRIVSQWGPTKERAEQRLTNLSGLREFIEQYQCSSEDAGSPTSIPGLFSWLEDLADDRDNKALDESPVDPAIQAVHIGTYHGSKGLEWPVVFAGELDASPRTRLFNLRTHTDTDKLDLDDPLANRGLRLWIAPCPKMKSKVKETLEASTIGDLAMAAATSEDLRLLYVGLTRARDIMVLLHDPATDPDWLDVAGNTTLLQSEGDDGFKLGGRALPFLKSTTVHQEYNASPQRAPEIAVPVLSDTHTDRLPLLITPSAQAPLDQTATSDTIEFGSRLKLNGKVDDRDYGDAMHRILAAEIQNPEHPDRIARATRILAHWDLQISVTPEQALVASDCYREWIQTTFKPISQHVEVPFTSNTSDGQQASGFIDHLILTANGPVIIDHKSFQGKLSDQADKAASYSGQLALYQKVVNSSHPDTPPPATWIHFISTGTAILVSPKILNE